MEKILYLEQGEKYSDKQEGYFMVPNWLFDEGEYIELDVYERMALIYIIRCVNRKIIVKGKVIFSFYQQITYQESVIFH